MDTPTAPADALEEQARSLGARVLSRGTEAASFAVEEGLRAARAGLFLTGHTLESMLPALTSLSEVREDVTRSFQDALAGRKTLGAHFAELGQRVGAGSRYRTLVNTLGRELLGSAVYPGEQVLLANDVYRLSYLPPKPGSAPGLPAIFFLGGFIPYGDRLFRFLPEASFYERFLERGLPVYAMELAGEPAQMKGLGQVTLERQLGWIEQMAEAAFRHNGGRKLIAQGYCGSGMQLLAYLAARPERAEALFKVASLFVTPVDARRCPVLADSVANVPRSTLWGGLMRAQLTGGYLRGLEMWAGLDLSLKNVFVKTPVGRFATGWKQPAYARVQSGADLDPAQRFDLAAAYWISVDNARRFPLPVDLARRAVHLYDQGIGPDGALGFEHQGRPVSLKAIAEKTSLKVVSFYGGADKLVQEESGSVLRKLLGPRYAQVLHPRAGHVSYVLFPKLWQAGHPKALAPNPIDALLAAYGEEAPRAAEPRAPRARRSRARSVGDTAGT